MDKKSFPKCDKKSSKIHQQLNDPGSVKLKLMYNGQHAILKPIQKEPKNVAQEIKAKIENLRALHAEITKFKVNHAIYIKNLAQKLTRDLTSGRFDPAVTSTPINPPVNNNVYSQVVSPVIYRYHSDLAEFDDQGDDATIL